MVSNPARRGFASDLLWQKAQTCLARGQWEDARKVLAAYAALGRGKGLHAQLLTAQIAWREGRVREATRYALDAARMAPDEAEALCAAAGMLLDVGENVAALECLARPSLAACDDPLLLMQLAMLRKRLEQHAEALALLDKAKALLEQAQAPSEATSALRFARGQALLFSGRIEEAEEELASSLRDAPGRGCVAAPLVRLRRQTPERNYLSAIEAGARLAVSDTEDQAAFEFARYKTLEDLGRHEEAWLTLTRANALMHTRLPDGAAQHHAWLEQFLAAWSAPDMKPGVTEPDGPQPIFIVGMPRSGTTVLERMLGNHSRVAVAGELLDFSNQLHWIANTRNVQRAEFLMRLPDLDYAELGRRYLAQTQWRACGKAFFIDKQPPNWVWAAAIHRALPHASILHLVRDPMDICFSNWRAYFGDAAAYSYDLGALARVFKDYQRAMAHWHRIMPGAILDVPYAGLIREPENTLREVFAFCGLEWEPGCTDITRNTAPSATPSAAQVRSNLHGRAFGEWRRYEDKLEPLLRMLETP